MKGKKEHMKHRATGGGIAGRAGGGKIDGEPESGGHPVKLHEQKSESGHKRGGKVHGKHAAHRLDKRARGGRMTPSEPLSGADAPDLPYAKAHMTMKSHGAGKGTD